MKSRCVMSIRYVKTVGSEKVIQVDVEIENQMLSVEVDTGACILIVSHKMYVESSMPKIELNPTNTVYCT